MCSELYRYDQCPRITLLQVRVGAFISPSFSLLFCSSLADPRGQSHRDFLRTHDSLHIRRIPPLPYCIDIVCVCACAACTSHHVCSVRRLDIRSMIFPVCIMFKCSHNCYNCHCVCVCVCAVVFHASVCIDCYLLVIHFRKTPCPYRYVKCKHCATLLLRCFFIFCDMINCRRPAPTPEKPDRVKNDHHSEFRSELPNEHFCSHPKPQIALQKICKM